MQKRQKTIYSGLRAITAATFVCYALLLGGCGSRDYWPMQEGNQWKYILRAREGGVFGETIFTVKSVKKEGQVRRALIQTTTGHTTQPLSESVMISSPQGVYESSRTSLISTDVGVIKRTREVTPGNFPPFIIYGKPRVGEEWSFSCNIKDKYVNLDTDVRGGGKVEDKETIYAAAGKFKAFKIRWYTVDTSGNFSEERIFWIKRGIGPVKIEVSNYAGRMVLMLKSAIVNGKHIGE